MEESEWGNGVKQEGVSEQASWSVDRGVSAQSKSVFIQFNSRVCLLHSFSLPQNNFILLRCKVTCVHLIVGGCDFCFP